MEVRLLQDLGGIVLQASAPCPLFQEVSQEGPCPSAHQRLAASPVYSAGPTCTAGRTHLCTRRYGIRPAGAVAWVSYLAGISHYSFQVSVL